MKVIFVFIDGLGIGEKSILKNPVYRASTPNIDYIIKKFGIVPTDSCMDVPGLPQSATGQTAIFTGINASKVLGRHLNGKPTITLKKLLHNNNLFKELRKRHKSVTNANAYRTEYLKKMIESKNRRYYPSVTSVMTMENGLSFRTLSDYRAGNAVCHDITGNILVENGYSCESITPGQAAQRIYEISRRFDFTLFEHFMTDITGHRKDMRLSVNLIELLDCFLGNIISLLDMKKDILFITSDHGNIEDITVGTHTFNMVPTIICSEKVDSKFINVSSLTDIMPAVIKLFNSGEILYGD